MGGRQSNRWTWIPVLPSVVCVKLDSIATLWGRVASIGEGEVRRVIANPADQENFGITCRPISSIVCITFSCGRVRVYEAKQQVDSGFLVGLAAVDHLLRVADDHRVAALQVVEVDEVVHALGDDLLHLGQG